MTFTLPLKDTVIKESETVTLECQLSKPDQKVTWYRNGKAITPDEHIAISADGVMHTLTINNSVLEDGAEYSVKCGDQTTSAKLTVEGWKTYFRTIYSALLSRKRKQTLTSKKLDRCIQSNKNCYS